VPWWSHHSQPLSAQLGVAMLLVPAIVRAADQAVAECNIYVSCQYKAIFDAVTRFSLGNGNKALFGRTARLGGTLR
jgi:hypothetical protein